MLTHERERSRTLARVLCHPEVLRKQAENGELRNMRLVCKTFRDAVNVHVTRLTKEDDEIVTIPTCFPNIQVLSLARGFQHLVDLSSLPPLTNLRKLIIHSRELQDISHVSSFTALEDLELTESLWVITMESSVLEPISACTKLKRLVLKASFVRDLSFIRSTIENLDISVTPVQDITALPRCTNLVTLNMRFCMLLEDFSPLSRCTGLLDLDMSECENVTDMAAISACTKLEKLNMSKCKNVADISHLRTCANLVELDLSECSKVTDMAAISACTKLEKLNMSKCENVVDISPLSTCSNLVNLDMSECSKVTDIAALSACSELKELNMFGCRDVNDISPLSPLPLVELNLRDTRFATRSKSAFRSVERPFWADFAWDI